jgi:hypothetical protein
VDTKIKALTKMEQIIVPFHSGSASTPAQDDMQGLGWKIMLGDAIEK